MELPVKMHPSRLAPSYLRWYLSMLALSGAIAGGIFYAFPVIEGYLGGFAVYLYGIAVLPLLRLLPLEWERHHHVYVFYKDRVVAKRGGRTRHQEDIPYSQIANVTSVSPLLDRILRIGYFEIDATGTEDTVMISGVRHPDMVEDLLMQRNLEKYGIHDGDGGSTDDQAHDPIPDGPDASDQDKIEHIREEMQQLEQQYNNGEISKSDYENSYYYLQGELDALQGDV